MIRNSKRFSRGYREGLLSAVSAGFFFVLLGAIFATTPYLFDRILDFFRNFDFVQVPYTEIHLPVPVFPSAHLVIYSAVTQFSFIWGLFQVVILLLRTVIRSSLGKKAETAGNVAFWLGTSYLIRTFLNETTTTTTWFVFWTAMIMLIGVSLIIRAIVLMTGLYTKKL